MPGNGSPVDSQIQRTASFSQHSESSQTAQEYIAAQLSLEADAREALPYQFDTCTKPLGPIRQSVYACLTCTPPPASVHQQFTPAGVCYSCSISCHGEHTLVELFTKRDFVCDCGTTRLGNSGTPCSLRLNTETGRKGGVTAEESYGANKYNQNFQGKFCGCGEEYDPIIEKGTMYQCLGLGHVEEGGCGEDWWHPECLMGLPRVKPVATTQNVASNGFLETVKEEADCGAEQIEGSGDAERPNTTDGEAPVGFPDEEDFDHLLCYKCVGAFPWIKQYAGTRGFLKSLPNDGSAAPPHGHALQEVIEVSESKKRKAEEELEDSQDSSKKARADQESTDMMTRNLPTEVERPSDVPSTTPKHAALPSAPTATISLFVKEDFRDHLCRCPECFPRLSKHPQLLQEEETYEPPVSESDQEENRSVAGRSVHSGSLLDRGEAALSSMDRVRAIEGVMAYNHVRDKVKAFLQPFAESGQPVGTEDIKSYFAKLRGDEQAMREAAAGAASGGAVQGDGRKEQDGY